MTGNPPVDVQAFGQSIWLDNLSRKLIASGEMKRLIDEDGVLGVTSNPTIFQKAIGGSDDYDDQLLNLLDLEPYAIFETLAVQDIQNALDLYRPVYDRTGGRDGYVSLEVSPLIADDTASTVAEAKRLAAAVDRPNLMVKIPSTPAGIPAIEEATAEGINVNVTLIFSNENYKQVMEAYIRGLERRAEAGKDIRNIHSVASFFLSRIDTAVDRVLDNNIRAAQGRDLGRVALNNRLKGKAAISNAKVAYKFFLDTFHGNRFAKLREAGGNVQRVLWASTGTKNPAYPDTMYVDNLIGADTVNTLPPDTLKAFKDHGTVADTLGQGIEEAEQTLDMLAEVGINLEQITAQLQTDGVEAFADSYRALLDGVDAKRSVLKTGIIRLQDLALGIYEEPVRKAILGLEAEHANERIWAHDGTFWKEHSSIATKIADRLGWLDVWKTIDRDRLMNVRANAAGGEFDHVLLLGMGGSSLAPEVLSKTFGSAPGYPQLRMLDSTDPTYILKLESEIDVRRTLFIVSSKSGTTVETNMFFQYFYAKTGGNGAQFIAITDPGSSLDQLAQDKGFRDIFRNPADIGGRYSALSYFGLVPAALIGVDLERLWASMDQMIRACGPTIPEKLHPGIWLGAIMGVLALNGRDKVTLICSPSVATFGNWVEQLIAESLGKEGKGVVPIVGATVGKPHDYSSDRLIIFLKVEGDDNDDIIAGVRALREAGHPRLTLRLSDTYALGGEFFRWEYATAVAGKVLDINPFDEPNVTESKQNTSRLLDVVQNEGRLPQFEPLMVENGVQLYVDEKMARTMYELCRQHNYSPNTLTGLLAPVINTTDAGDYFALLAYLPPTDEINTLLEHIRRRLRHVTHRAVTLGYGPRFLHSTGQLHKGGANNGVFIQLTGDHPQDAPIPDAPYTFGTLEAAQAAGDLEALLSKNRRAVRLHISGDPVKGLNKLLEAVEAAGERRQ